MLDYMVMKKNKKFHVSQLGNRVLTCWIAKDWRKTTWVKFSASPAASTNQNKQSTFRTSKALFNNNTQY